MNKKLAVFSLLLVLGVISGAAGAARLSPALCSCTPAAFETRVRTADKIYVATVRRIAEQDGMRQPGREDPPVIVTLDVTEGFKDASRGQNELLHDSLTRVTCSGHDFKQGEEYLVFAYRRIAAKYEHWSLYDFKTGTYGVGGLCGGTKLLSDTGTAEELAELRRLKGLKDPVLAPTLEAKP